MNPSRLENKFTAMEEDFDTILAESKKRLKEDKEDLRKKSPRVQNSRETLHKIQTSKEDFPQGEGLALNIGGYERQTLKQRQMKEERQREYRQYLADQTYRSSGFHSKTDIDESIRNQDVNLQKKSSSKQEYREQIDREYEELLKKKRKDENDYRVQFGDVNGRVGDSKPKKRVIEFGSEEDYLIEFVISEQSKAKRGKSAESLNKKHKPVTMKSEGRSNSVPPSGQPLFGESGDSNIAKQKQQQYKKDLEDQIRERDLLRAKDKLKRLGRVTSDVDVNEIELPKNKKNRWALPVRRKTNINISSEEDENNTENRQSIANIHTQQQLKQQQQLIQQQLMQQQFYPPAATPMYAPMVLNPMLAWNNFSQQPVVGYNNTLYPNMGPNNNTVPPKTEKSSARGSRKQWETKDLDGVTLESSKDSIPLQTTPLKNLSKRTILQPPGGGSHGVLNASPRPDEDLTMKKARQLLYQEELKRQIEDKKEKDQKEKEEHERRTKKLEAEIEAYDPWGREGCGAPVRNKDGKIVANLKALQIEDISDAQSKQMEAQPIFDPDIEESPMLRALAESLNKVGFIETYKAAVASEITPTGNKQSDAVGGPATYGRGAALKELKGINTKKSPRDKVERDEYKQFLQQQVQAKRKKQEEAKERARLEEEKEAKIILEQQRRMQEEYEREKEHQRQKEEEVRKQNEELRIMAEKKRFEEEQKKRKIEEEYQKEVRIQAEKKFEHHNDIEPIDNIRSDSPPVPAVAKERRRSVDAQKDFRTQKYPGTYSGGTRKGKGTDMDYLDSIRKSMEHQAKVNETNYEQQKDLINQLTVLREQLQKQENKIQEELHHNKMKYTELHKESAIGRSRSNEIFAKATKKTTTSTKDDYIINRNAGYTNGDSSYKTLDHQQREYMRGQQERLNNLKKNLQQKQPSKLQTRGSAKSLLDSDSKFISMQGHQDVTSEVKDDRNLRYSSARSRRRDKDKNVGDVFQEFFPREKDADTTSIATYRVEEMAKRNEERLRQYNIKHEDGDCDNIVNNFLHTSGPKHEPSLPSESRFQT